MTYRAAVDFLYSQLPMYSRIGSAAYKKDIHNIEEFTRLLNHPEKKFRSIHIAGTNGKGSTSHMLAAILQHGGYKTGLYTSPHLKDFRERILINGKMISENDVADFVDKYKEEVVRIGCSFFEWTVGLAFDHFAKEKVDIAVIETGLGGRLDSTNIITPVLSIITNISNDHEDILGSGLEQIATEKAGIIKPAISVVIGEYSSQVQRHFDEVAERNHSQLEIASENWTLEGSEMKGSLTEYQFINQSNERWIIETDLNGSYQRKNLPTVLESCNQLNQLGFELSKSDIIGALKKVKELTGLRGRWEVLQQHPTIIADVAHNEAGIKEALNQLHTYHYDELHFVIGFVKEKNLATILPHFPREAKYYFCAPAIPRGLDAAMLKETASEFQMSGETYSSAADALAAAKQNAKSNDLIYVGGSTFVVANIL